MVEFDALNARIVRCERCPRLRAHCAEVARVKRASFRDETYHGRPVPNFGDPHARLLLVGLAPAAHGANRTGRMFTGDRSGDFLFRAMHRAGFASQPTATAADDGLRLIDVLITATCHCAPPGNAPTPEEIRNCEPFLDATFDLAANVKVVIALGKTGFDSVLRLYQRRGWITRRSAFAFGHGAEHRFPGTPAPAILCTYHPSQQNTFTGKLTPAMLDAVFARAGELLDSSATAIPRREVARRPSTDRSRSAESRRRGRREPRGRTR
ncbi:MAG: uracil-DNA glycosylase [Planctomycetes bacterium]|nr:uracil-DNA glycosylase [Planctomycetota bacterium]MBI3843328.1 uracil-DNA glycosylase [Planctomycetota bacterium]